ncbi:MAG: glucuronate isomerase [Oscillospiraceae bacterium]|nr:glucuronate isomerase [Oscillospiraceae bacterium]
MRKFMDKDFLLTTDTAKKLYAACENTPIFDWHCHLQPKEIYENKEPGDIAYLWLAGDHYKWRAMRSCGINEEYITGNKSPYEKFKAWAETMPNLIGNPLYHWTHLELQRYFDIYEPLSPATCDDIWERANAKIKAGGFTPRELIEKSNVSYVCTTDDAADTLEYHKLIAEDKSFKCKVLPAFRPDKGLAIEADAYCDWVKALEGVYGKEVKSFTELKAAFKSRIDFFAEMGCRASDHAFTYVPYKRAAEDELNTIFSKRMGGNALTAEEVDKYKTELMLFLANEYAKLGWGMEVHIGALRNNNTNMFNKLGPDTGFDSVADYEIAVNLSKLLNAMLTEYKLPKTILFTLNPKDNYVLGTMLGNFQSDEAQSKIQFGSAWWFNDNYDGMRQQMQALMNLGVIAKFVGMITDSRSFLSYPRHEYFRRILCELIGDLVEDGKYPDDIEFLSGVVQDISYNNAIKYFGVK